MKNNKGKLEDEMIEDGTMYDEESAEFTARLARNVSAGTARHFQNKKKSGAIQPEENLEEIPDDDYYVIIRNAVLLTFYPSYVKYVCLATLTESIQAFNALFIGVIIKHILDKEADYRYGVIYVAIFILTNGVSISLRNVYMASAMEYSVTVRRTLVAYMFKKV